MSNANKNKAIESFIEDSVALNDSRVERIEKGIEVIKNLLQNNDPYSDLYLDLDAQGSYRHGTAIRPAGDDDFDLDLLFDMRPVDGWEPVDYLENLHNFFAGFDRYKDKVDNLGKTRCVTIDYDTDFHIDVVPSIEIDGSRVIMNKKSNSFEPTDGEGYGKWFDEKNAIANGKLCGIVQLFKYIRDYKGTFKIKSIVLTTLFGQQVLDDDAASQFGDITTATSTLISRLDKFLQDRPIMPEICNPALPTEKFTSRHWTQADYANFRNKFHTNAEKILSAIAGDDQDFETEMKELLGDAFNLPEKKEFSSLVEPLVLSDYSHKALPPWQLATNGGTEVKIIAELTDSRGRYIGPVQSRAFQAFPKYTIKYRAEINVRDPAIEIFWQVVNTGTQAARAGGLRGKEFFSGRKLDGQLSSDRYTNWETTAYHGIHWIECFAVKNQQLLARSGPFYVPIVNPSVGRYRRP
jgi:hypothetical protein